MNETSSVKIALKLVLYYIVVLIVGTVGCSLVFAVYRLCTDIVAGQQVSAFPFGYVMSGIFIFVPVIIIISCVLMCMYLIRHSSHSWLPLCVYGVMFLASWLVLLPVDFELQDAYSAAASGHPAPIVSLSSGYFRRVENDVLYYSAVTEDNVVTGAYIATTEGAQNVQTFSQMRLPPKKEFADFLIQSTVEMPAPVAFLAGGARRMVTVAREAYRAGRASWFCFLSLGLALISVAGLRHFSRWRLVNVLSLICATLFILAFNLWAVSPSVQAMSNPLAIAMNGLASKVPQIQYPFLVLCNIFSFVVLSVVGLMVDIKRKRNGDDAVLDAEFDDGFGGDEDL